ncbi:MAG: cell division protein FtsA [Elusimicrobiota bacterium]
MAKQDLLAGIEFGSGKVVCAVAKRDKDGALNILAGSEVKTTGLQKGNVISIEETVNAIKECVENVEELAGERVASLQVGIKGQHIETYNFKGAINISRTDKEITEEDRELVLEAARQLQLSNDREIIETIPLTYIVDQQRGVPNPIGMEGNHLGVAVHLVSASTMALNNIYKCVNKAGFKVDGVAYSLLALGDVSVTPEEKDLGVVLVDIGGQVTDVAFYVMGGIHLTKELNIGGDHITRDIAYGMRTSLERSRELKEKYGWAHRRLVSENEEKEIPYIGVDGITERVTTFASLSEIIYPRVEEIFHIVKREILSSEYAHMVPSGIVLAGGTSHLKGICEIGEKILDMPVRLGPPQSMGMSENYINNPALSSVFGLLKYAEREQLRISKRLGRKPFFAGMRKKLEEIF